MCPLVNQIESKDIPTILNDEDAVKIYKEVIVLKELVKNREKALKEYVKSKPEGAVKIDENKVYKLTYSETITKKRGINKDELKKFIWEFAEKNNLDPLIYFDLDNKKLEPLIIEGVLKDYFTISKRKSFVLEEVE
ncbi:hypothetical protein [Marinitoga lauensis]|uniref:hypothetical protein n=1 Tax=Marinitoga lauensis TaxID=2201189 RepID=UPI001012C8AA|nr:hypothetical protein [Marinitoga lauensis]